MEEMARRGSVAKSIIQLEHPELLELFETYQNEAVNARKFLEPSLLELDEGAEILEVGGGILALAVQLASEGYKITTVEPVGDGFNGITFIMKVYLDISLKENLDINLVESPIEDFCDSRSFDFIFSINVMEHVKDPYSVLLKLTKILKKGRKYRFTCPNYDFPYEPHFARWIFTRRNNAFFLEERRASSIIIDEQEVSGLYKSLNFITLSKLRKFSTNHNISIKSNSRAFFNLLFRAIHDRELAKRHPRLASAVKIVFLFRLHIIVFLVPIRWQPIIDIEASFDNL